MDDAIERLRRLDPVPAPMGPPAIDALLSRLPEKQSRASRPRRPTTTRHGGSRTRWIAGRVPVLLAVATSVLVAAFALTFIRHGPPSGPTPPSSSGGGQPPALSGPPVFPPLSGLQRKQIDYVMKADGTTVSQDPACEGGRGGQGNPARKPSLSQGTPSASLLATLGLLRRPATTVDRLPPRKIWHGPHSRPHSYRYGTYPAVTGIYARYIRYARHRDGANYYLVPAENVNWRAPVPVRCYREQVSALHHELAQIPRDRRAGIFALQSTYLAYERASAKPYPGVCLAALNGTGNGDGSACYAISEIRAGQTLSSGAPAGVPVVYGLAPDGVHSVTFYYKGLHLGHPLTALVINNVFILHDPGDRLPHNGFPGKLVWRAAGGGVIKTITWP